MEYIDSTTHESLEVLACDNCFDPQWTQVLRDDKGLKGHWCTSANEWRYGYYGSDITYQDAGEANYNYQAHIKAQAREIAQPILKHIDEVLEGPNVSLR